jgi:hypothetical protein
MKKTDVGQTVAILANLGVIAGILFLGYEIRQNTSAVQADTFQGLIESSADYLQNMAVDPNIWDMIIRLETNPDELSPSEMNRLSNLNRAQWIRYQGAYQHWRRGSLSDSDWESYDNAICTSSAIDHLQRFSWPAAKRSLLEDFVSHVERCRPDLAELAEIDRPSG